jgi:penicillin G amidase
MKRLALRILAFLALLLALGVAAAFTLVRHQLPDLHAPRLPGLSAPVPVDFDARAVPTVHAATLLDAARAQGYLVARERMFQLELQRRAAAGTLSEVFGEAALPIDKLHRLYGFRLVADAAVPLLPAAERDQLEAYAAGVNAFLESHPHDAGLELKLLGITPPPWTAADSLLVLLLMYEDLSTSWHDELRFESLASLPVAERRFLMPSITGEDVLVVPDADPKPTPEAPAFFAAPHALLSAPWPVPADVLGLPASAGERLRGIGSNNWVVAPSRSKSGKALLANDPHLGIDEPGVWYEMRIEIGAHWAQGVALVGLPGIVIGQTDKVAWGFTNLGTDVQDLYKERKIAERVESIAVKGGAAVELRVPVGAHGPQVRAGYSLAWVALDPRNLRTPLGTLMSATDWASFNEAIDDYDGPAQNVVYADIDGHIGWRASGLVPIRRDSDDGLHPHDGSDPEEDWRGFVPMSDLPRVLDPPSGFIVTANQRVIGTSFPYLVTADWGPPNRARRITERILAAGKLDRDGMESIQLDVVSLFHRDLMRLLATQVPALASFASWDGAASADSVTYVKARAWEIALRGALDARVTAGHPATDFKWDNDQTTLLAMLRADDAAWMHAGLGDKQALLHDASLRADAWIAESPAPTWGERNALHVHHPLGRGGGLLSWIFDPPSFPQSGAGDTVRAAGRAFGQSMRLVVDWGDPDATTLVIPLGQSGHVGSAHRFDQEEWWRRGDPGGTHTRLKMPKVGEGMTLAP